MPKMKEWRPEPDDEPYELEAEIAWVTGISRMGPYEFDVDDFMPIRHGVADAFISNFFDPDWGLVSYPGCACTSLRR